MTMTECKNCGNLATKTHNLTTVNIDCECGSYSEEIMNQNPRKAVIYDRSIMDYKVVNREDMSIVYPYNMLEII